MTTVKSLRQNIMSLGAFQVFNFILTLSTLPYLTRTLGAAGWGQIVFVQLVMNYMSWVANWGFYLGATQKVAANRNDKEELSHILVTTWVAQWFLTVVLVGVLIISLSTVPRFSDNKSLYLAGAGLLLGNALTPLWYLNGLEKIRESATIQILVKLLALPFIFILVKENSDTQTYLLINSASSVVVGMFTMYWIHQSGAITWRVPHLHDIRTVIKQDFHLFTSTLWANLNGSVIPTVLGIAGGPTELGYYNIAERAKSAAITILHPITHALFPRMCYLFSTDPAQARRLLKRSGMAMFALSGSMSGMLLLFPSSILGLLGGHDFSNGESALAWLAFTPVLTTASAFIIHQVLVPSGDTQGYNKAMFTTLLLSAALAFPFVSSLGAQGAAIVSFCTESFAALFLIFYIRQRKLVAAWLQ